MKNKILTFEEKVSEIMAIIKADAEERAKSNRELEAWKAASNREFEAWKAASGREFDTMMKDLTKKLERIGIIQMDDEIVRVEDKSVVVW